MFGGEARLWLVERVPEYLPSMQEALRSVPSAIQTGCVGADLK